MRKPGISSHENLAGRLTAYTTAAGALMLTAGTIEGQVIYSGIQNMVFDTPGILNPLDLNDDGITDFNLGIAGYSSIFNTYDQTYSAFIQNAGTTNGWIGTAFYVYQLSHASLVSSGRTWTNDEGNYRNLGHGLYDNLLGTGNALIGIRFVTNYSPWTGNYGWLRVNIEREAKEIVVVDWAYEEQPLDSILTGVLEPILIPPEPWLWADIMGPVYMDFPLNINFTEEITSFTTGDIRVIGCSVVPGSLTTTDNQHFEVYIHPETEGTIEVSIPGSVVQDLDGNLNMPGHNRIVADYVVLPKPVLTTDAEMPVMGEFVVTVTFNESVHGLEESDFLITNGTLNPGSLTALGENDSLFTIAVTPIATGDVLIDLPVSVVLDDDSNENFPAETLVVQADFDSPRTELSTGATEPVTGIFTIIIEFSEEVHDFLEHEVDITNGYPGAGTLHTEDGITFTLDIIPQSTGDVVIEVPAGVAQDIDGFSNLASDPLVVAAVLPDALTGEMNEGIFCYPNPGQGRFNIEVTQEYVGGIIEIYNNTGNLVYESNIKDRLTHLDLAGLPKGIYQIRLIRDTNRTGSKLVIE